jgi:glycosyltransferase involved in cell wall biosynthesis
MRIDMFVYNRCTADARVLKEAKTLAEVGHRVRVLAVLDASTPPTEDRDGFRIVRIDRQPLHYRLLRVLRIASGIGGRRLAALEEGDGGTRSTASFARLARPALAPLALVAKGIRGLLLSFHKPLMFLDYYWRAYRLVRADPPDALHAHDLNTLPVASALARRLRVPLTYDAHELYPEISTLSAREASIWRFLERRLARRADHVLTVCDSIATEMERRCSVPRPIVLLNCPASNGASDRSATALATYPPYNAGKSPEGEREPVESEPTILYQGGFSPHRGLETLVRSAHGLRRGRIVLMGWGRLEEALRALIAGEGLEERVTIVDPVPADEVVAHAARATIGVIPYEPVGLNNTFTTPNKLFDYMAAGLPVVASRLPELSRFVEGEEIGVTFTPGDPASLSAAIDRTLTDPAAYDRMRERAREASRRFTWERESRKLLALYERP